MNIYYHLFVFAVAAMAIFIESKKYNRASDLKSATVAKVCGYVYMALTGTLLAFEFFLQ